MQEQVILLNGPSSSGKSTLAKSLQMVIEENKNLRYEIVSIDDYLKMTMDHVIYEDDVYEISIELCEKILEVLRSGKGVIIDHVITSERIFNQFKEQLNAYKIYMIQVTCPINILCQREVERNNRYIGSAKASYDYLFPKEGYDLTLDTSLMSAEKCAIRIFEVLFGRIEKYKISDLTLMTQLTQRTIRNYIKEGRLKGQKVQGTWTFTKEDLITFFSDPYIQQGLAIKNQILVDDFIKDTKKKNPSICSIYDYPVSDDTQAEELCQKIMDQMNHLYQDDNQGITMSYYYNKPRCEVRIILIGEKKKVNQVLSYLPD